MIRDQFRLIHGDNREILPTLPDASIDACVSDPPYELGFMGKKWDRSGIAYDVAMWREVLRVLKPGAHLVAFGGTRTYHRMASAIEDAGFEIRDQLAWCYGSGFPKSLDVAQAIDRAAGKIRKRVPNPRGKGLGPGSSIVYAQDAWTEANDGTRSAREPMTSEAQPWRGWGTALKPAWEPIVLARKPLSGTVAANVLKHGVGALNIDECRIALVEGEEKTGGFGAGKIGFADPEGARGVEWKTDTQGRWPANFVHDGSSEVLAAFPETDGANAPVAGDEPSKHGASGIFGARERVAGPFFGDTGSAARFFYCAKADRNDRDSGCEEFERRPLNWSSGDKNPGSFQSEGTDKTARNNHPTVKPTALMVWLVRLVTPRGGHRPRSLYGKREHRPRVCHGWLPLHRNRQDRRILADRSGAHRRRARPAIR